jgi:hypothetical protein
VRNSRATDNDVAIAQDDDGWWHAEQMRRRERWGLWQLWPLDREAAPALGTEGGIGSWLGFMVTSGWALALLSF